MRAFGHVAVVLCCGTVVLAQGQSAPPAGQAAPAASAAITAEAILAAAHAALGGAKLDAVKTFVVTGRTRRLQGNNTLPIEFEINAELPDKYVRKDEVPVQESDPTSRGFNGDKLIQLPPPAAPPPGAAPGRAGGPPMAPPAPATSVKQDFARLTLGMFAQSFSSYPLTFSYAGKAEAPQGTADVVDVKGAGNFDVRLFVNSATHLPVMISWTQPRSPALVTIMVPGQPKPPNLPAGSVVIEGPPVPDASASQDDKDKYAKAVADLRKEALSKPVEHRIYYADYRNTETPMFPHRLRRAIGADTTEETTLDVFQINQKINPKKFDPIK